MDIKKDNAMYMQIAQIAAKRSYAKRLQVGCVIVKNHSIVSFGWNGMPTGYDNCCEVEVDGKLVDAVPFLADFLLHHEKRAMPQLMKFAKGEITEKELFNDPLAQDWKVDYKKRLIVNSAHNAMVICMVMDLVGVTPPQDILYNTGLKEGDKVMIVTDEGVKPKTITRVDKGGAFLGKSMGYLLKRDRWYKVENTAMQ